MSMATALALEWAGRTPDASVPEDGRAMRGVFQSFPSIPWHDLLVAKGSFTLGVILVGHAQRSKELFGEKQVCV